MNTNDSNPIPATHLRQKRTYTQPNEDSITVASYSDDQAHHLDRVKRVLRSPEPTTFKEYQEWLRDWRLAYAHEVRLVQDLRVATARYKLAGGFGRRQENTPYQMTPKIKEAYDAACKNLGGEGRAYGTRCALLNLRITRKPLGKSLYEAQVALKS